MALTKTVTKVVDNQTIAALTEYALASVTAVDCTSALIADVECVLTYNASATVAATVRVYTSSDNTNWGSSPVDQFVMPFTANTQKRWSKTVIPSAKYLKATIYNADPTYSVTAATVNVTLQTM
jgi:hypothetical protein